MAQTYGNWQKYQSKNPVQRALIGRFMDQVRMLLEPLAGRSVLDAGCGEAFILDMALSACPNLRIAGGIDMDVEALARGHQLFPRIPVLRADILHLPFPDSTFDIVICTEVLEHFEQPEHALRELCRVASNYCLLSVPHEPFFRASNLLRGKNISRLGNDVEHYQNWSRSAFVGFAGQYLEIVDSRLSFPWQIVLGRPT